MPDRNNNMTEVEINVIKRRRVHDEPQGHDEPMTTKKIDFDDQKGWISLNQFLLTKLKMTTLVKLIVAGVVGLFIVANLLCAPVLYLLPEIMSHMIFQHYIYVPFKNLSNMHAYELTDSYTFRLAHDNVELGAWHVLPHSTSLKPSENKDHHFELNLVAQRPDEKNIIVLYLHGNTNDRSTWHRVGLYKVFRSMGYHVVAIDYRGYGDSTGSPTEADVVKDALFTYEYIKSKAPWATIYIWGHSLGTGVTSHMARILSEQNKPPEGIILEAPFFNILEEVEFHPFGWVFNWNSIAMNAIRGALENINLRFRSDIHLTKVTSKIMILHSEDDMIIPVTQAERLHQVVKKKGKSPNVTFHRFPASLWCGHNHIYWAPNITSIIKDFIN